MPVTALAPDSFYSAKLRIGRAQEHLDELEARIKNFFGEKPHTRITEPDPNGTHEIYKIRLTKPFPLRWRLLATELIEHVRASLDHATWASAFLHTKNPNLKFGVFPFVEDPLHFEAKLKGVSKDCPPEIQTLLRKTSGLASDHESWRCWRSNREEASSGNRRTRDAG